jgi:hypothetical protein
MDGEYVKFVFISTANLYVGSFNFDLGGSVHRAFMFAERVTNSLSVSLNGDDDEERLLKIEHCWCTGLEDEEFNTKLAPILGCKADDDSLMHSLDDILKCEGTFKHYSETERNELVLYMARLTKILRNPPYPKLVAVK